MQKVLIVTLCMFMFLVGNAFSQVIADFETDDGGFVTGWGGAITGLSQVADPSGVSAGVLQMSINADLGDGKAAMKKPGTRYIFILTEGIFLKVHSRKWVSRCMLEI